MYQACCLEIKQFATTFFKIFNSTFTITSLDKVFFLLLLAVVVVVVVEVVAVVVVIVVAAAAAAVVVKR
jgi:hypothetical protein